ncbi:hypothetical protein BDM02DRAFT_3114087 [Thelephora ganbajun]|uniref:Uncharacterized protein n=1 Tax=Thelephora ganbajun TaxID=370292 RepID=A0ACB6ZHU5_THEGA|nr:hypothetical protein BDM02DRAFT_3114087 [Thelephora ganbajun]
MILEAGVSRVGDVFQLDPPEFNRYPFPIVLPGSALVPCLWNPDEISGIASDDGSFGDLLGRDLEVVRFPLSCTISAGPSLVLDRGLSRFPTSSRTLNSSGLAERSTRTRAWWYSHNVPFISRPPVAEAMRVLGVSILRHIDPRPARIGRSWSIAQGRFPIAGSRPCIGIGGVT